MSRRVFALPIRTISSPLHSQSQWVCRRCLATQTATASPSLEQTIPAAAKDPNQAANYDPALPAAQRDYRLKKSDFFLKKPLPHAIPTQYLQHSTSGLLHDTEKTQREQTRRHKKIQGVVVSAGKMHKTVKVRVPGQQWNKRIGKYYDSYTNHLVHDPKSSLLAGDVVELHRLRVSSAVHHVVAAIVSPFGKPIEDRPPIPSPDERLAEYKRKRFAKLERRTLRRQAALGNGEAIRELRSMGLDPGKGVEEDRVEIGDEHKRAQDGQHVEKGSFFGEKGQKLPKGVLPGGKHEIGNINERAKKNKAKAMALNEKAEDNLLEAKEKGEQLESVGLDTDSVVPEKRRK